MGHWAIPSLKVLVPGNNNGSCFEPVNELAKLNDAALPKALEELEIKLDGFKYSMHYLNISFGERQNNPHKYEKYSMFGKRSIRGIDSCGGRRVVTEYELCSDPSEYVFFDSRPSFRQGQRADAKLMWEWNTHYYGALHLKALFQASLI
ncbi:GDSL esterase/lipase 1-like [Hibiscus syriacus]|uniref:GDSL esterase/lipase 1-like n=1 Tax=Hibiscus syriacus TaxID=106335 RepID=UPI00192482E3|nr:GDSL esterase/lipase 1-like [Hibiscus syriacus]